MCTCIEERGLEKDEESWRKASYIDRRRKKIRTEITTELWHITGNITIIKFACLQL